MNADPVIHKRAAHCEAWRIAPGDTNKMVLLLDPFEDGANFVSIVEIFDVGGRTPPNRHEIGYEMFFVLAGEGRAHGPAGSLELRAGDSLLLKPGTLHEIENTGPGKLYCLTVMTPNDGFAELIRSGQKVPVTEDELAVIRGLGRGGA